VAAVDPARLSIALVHFPVLDRKGREVATSTVSLDLHDLARLARTYGLHAFYTVTPLTSQQALAQRITDYWDKGLGREFNPTRIDALQVLRVAETLDVAVDQLTTELGMRPRLVGTTARRQGEQITFSNLRRSMAEEDGPYLLLFGTGSGFTTELMEQCDHVLEPIDAGGDFNHLSVRSAASIVIDRLLS
jgi:hypothetical protein